MGGFSVPDVSSQGGYAGGGGLLGFLTQGLQGYQQAHKAKLEEKQGKEEAFEKKKMDESALQSQGLENTVLQAGLDEKAKSEQVASAQTIYDNVVSQAVLHPEILKDPSILQGFTAAANVLHKPLVKGKDGSIDVDAFNPNQFTALSTDQKAYYASLSIPERKTQMKGIAGVDSDFLKAPPVYTPKMQADLDRGKAGLISAGTKQKAELHREYIDDVKLPIWKRLENARAALTENLGADEHAKAYATINKLRAEANEISVRAAAIPQRLALEENSLSLRASQLQLSMDRLKFDQSKTALSSLDSTTRALDDYTTKTRGELQSAQKEYDAFIQTDQGKDPNNPLAATMLQRIHKMNDLVYTSEQQAGQARSALSIHQFQALGITQQSGKQSSILPRKSQGGGQPLGKAPEGTSDGATTEYNGKTLVARGGKWYAQ